MRRGWRRLRGMGFPLASTGVFDAAGRVRETGGFIFGTAGALCGAAWPFCPGPALEDRASSAAAFSPEVVDRDGGPDGPGSGAEWARAERAMHSRRRVTRRRKSTTVEEQCERSLRKNSPLAAFNLTHDAASGLPASAQYSILFPGIELGIPERRYAGCLPILSDVIHCPRESRSESAGSALSPATPQRKAVADEYLKGRPGDKAEKDLSPGGWTFRISRGPAARLHGAARETDERTGTRDFSRSAGCFSSLGEN
jgi:hypothetical protein